MKTPFLYIFIITSAITLSGALNLNASPSSAEERNDSSEKIASASAAGETQKLLSEEILSQLDLLEISDLLEINGQYNKKRFLNSQKGLVPDDYLAAAEEKVNQQLDKQKNRNIKTQRAYQAYELLSDKMSSISTNELRSYLAEPGLLPNDKYLYSNFRMGIESSFAFQTNSKTVPLCRKQRS